MVADKWEVVDGGLRQVYVACSCVLFLKDWGGKRGGKQSVQGCIL